MIDYKAWQFWFGLGQYVVAAVLAGYTWMSNRHKAHAQDMAQALGEIVKLETRVIKLETTTISHRELGKVYDRINEVSGQVAEIKGAIKGLHSALGRIEEYLLNKGGKS